MTQETVVEDWTNCTTFICIFTSPQQVRLQQTAYAKLSEKTSNIKIGNHRPKKPVLLWTSCVVHQCSWRLCCWASNLLSSKYPFIFKLVFECLFEHKLNKRGPVFWSNMGCSPPGQMLLWVENILCVFQPIPPSQRRGWKLWVLLEVHSGVHWDCWLRSFSIIKETHSILFTKMLLLKQYHIQIWRLHSLS